LGVLKYEIERTKKIVVFVDIDNIYFSHGSWLKPKPKMGTGGKG
jgi:hypothetical protein